MWRFMVLVFTAIPVTVQFFPEFPHEHKSYYIDRGIDTAPILYTDNNDNNFFLDHYTAMKIPYRVMSFTTADLYREGFRQNCDHVLSANNLGIHSSETRINTTQEQRLICYLLDIYNPSVRPVRNVSSTLRVNFSLSINKIFDLDDRDQVLTMSVWYEQRWVDEYLQWEPSIFGGLKRINIPSYYIFVPDIELYNTASTYDKKPMRFRAMVSADGTVFYGNPTKLVSSCHIDPTNFPFDIQVCRLKFGSWTYSGFEIDLRPGRDSLFRANFLTLFYETKPAIIAVDMSRLVINGKWDVMDVVQKRHSVRYSCCIEPYIDITYYVILQRKSMYYMLNMYFFTFMLAVMTVAVYKLPIDSGEKCVLGTAVLFSVSVFMLSLCEKLPESSEYVPVINIYLFFIMGMSAFSLMLTIGIHTIYFRERKTKKGSRLPQVSRLPACFMPLVRFYRQIRGKWVDDSVKMAHEKYNQKKKFIKQIRSYQRTIDFEMTTYMGSISNMATVDSNSLVDEDDGYDEDLLQQISDMAHRRRLTKSLNAINEAIEKLADNYETEITRAFYMLEWHELALFLDNVLFWIFLTITICLVSFVLYIASLLHPDSHQTLQNFYKRHSRNMTYDDDDYDDEVEDEHF